MSIDNPSAFPVNSANEGGPGSYGAEPGMTLRDWFAGQALVGIITSRKRSSLDGNVALLVVSQEAYGFADAMLAARTTARNPQEGSE